MARMIDIALSQTDRPYRVMASRPHGEPSRLVARGTASASTSPA
jgi:hypothetical protein